MVRSDCMNRIKTISVFSFEVFLELILTNRDVAKNIYMYICTSTCTYAHWLISIFFVSEEKEEKKGTGVDSLVFSLCLPGCEIKDSADHCELSAGTILDNCTEQQNCITSLLPAL